MPNAGTSKRARAVALAVFPLLVAGALFLVFGRAPERPAAATSPASGKWTCSMDPQFVLAEPGKCPKCFMDLIPLEAASRGDGRELLLSDEEMRVAGIEVGIALAHDGDAPEAVTVPESALLWNLGRAYVFAESHDGENASLSLREVEAGPREGGRRVLLAGLAAGDGVAVAGLFRIDSAMQILGKASLVNPNAGEPKLAEPGPPGSFQPAERSSLDPRRADSLALDEWFASYEGVRAALAKDDFAAATAPAKKLAATLSAAGAGEGELSPLLADLSRDAGDLAGAGALDRRRAAFDRLSADMVLLARRYGAPAGGLNLVFCPMAFGGRGAHWLQPGQTVDNPYHGLEMPRCGWLIESIGE